MQILSHAATMYDIFFTELELDFVMDGTLHLILVGVNSAAWRMVEMGWRMTQPAEMGAPKDTFKEKNPVSECVAALY